MYDVYTLCVNVAFHVAGLCVYVCVCVYMCGSELAEHEVWFASCIVC